MKTDGWLSDPSLPKSWLFKFQSEVYQSHSFIDAEGKHLSSKEAAVKYLTEEGDLVAREKVALFAPKHPKNLVRFSLTKTQNC